MRRASQAPSRFGSISPGPIRRRPCLTGSESRPHAVWRSRHCGNGVGDTAAIDYGKRKSRLPGAFSSINAQISSFCFWRWPWRWLLRLVRGGRRSLLGQYDHAQSLCLGCTGALCSVAAGGGLSPGPGERAAHSRSRCVGVALGARHGRHAGTRWPGYTTPVVRMAHCRATTPPSY
jgi:hypothetical protein